jgi:hypothetical protein
VVAPSDPESLALPRTTLAVTFGRLDALWSRLWPALRSARKALEARFATPESAARFVRLKHAVREGIARLAVAIRASGSGRESTGQTSGRRTWMVPAAAAAGLALGIAAVVAVVRHHANNDGAPAATEGPPSVANPSPRGSASPAAATEPSTPRAAPASTPCVAAGSAKTIAPNALLAAGVELRAMGDDIVLGFASGDRQAEARRMDASTLFVLASTAVRSKSTIARVTPWLSNKGLVALVDTERAAGPLRGRRTIATTPPLQVGESGGNIAWSHPGSAVAGALWPVDGAGAVEAVRGSSEATSDPTTAIAFRQAGGVDIGLARGRDTLSPTGGLHRFAQPAGLVGSPSIAVNDGVVAAVWAGRPSGGDAPWQLRWVQFHADDSTASASDLALPSGAAGSGAAGEQAMSPSVAAVPGKRFLLVWTEGQAARHTLRALTLGEDGQAIGAPIELSSPGVNAGQGQAAVTASGHGAVAFLESTEGGGFHVVATPITCGM